MEMTITEKILARASGRDHVRPGEIVETAVDLAMTQDILGAITFPMFRELGIPVWDREKVVVVIDHCAPPSSLLNAEFVAENIRFAEEFGITHFYNAKGVCHQILPEEGFVKPGMAIVATDSHTTTHGALGAFATGIGSSEMVWVLARGRLWLRVPETIRVEISGQLGPLVTAKDIVLKLLSVLGTNGATYKTIEYGGEVIRGLSIDGRLTLCNMALETGAKNAIIEVDETTRSYLEGRIKGNVESLASDPGAHYFKVLPLNVDDLPPQVACPHSPANVTAVADVAGKRVDQVLIGTCTGGRLEDFRMAAGLMRDKQVARRTRCLVIPASMRIYREMLDEGLMKVFADAGCVICNPHCGPCGGVQAGLIADGEVCVGNHNRNFRGRMGSPKGEVYLTSTATAAATAVKGELVDPRVFQAEGG
jgi:3-isopropylmalate/(R)-2-methylmalate dehydratase large subunit